MEIRGEANTADKYPTSIAAVTKTKIISMSFKIEVRNGS
jgi:hypothetical protein